MDFTKTRWIDCLRNRDWTKVATLTDVNQKTEDYMHKLK